MSCSSRSVDLHPTPSSREAPAVFLHLHDSSVLELRAAYTPVSLLDTKQAAVGSRELPLELCMLLDDES